MSLRSRLMQALAGDYIEQRVNDRVFELTADNTTGLTASSTDTAGETVSTGSALGLPAYFCGINAIARAVAMAGYEVVNKASGHPLPDESPFVRMFTEGFNDATDGYQSLRLIGWQMLNYGYYGAQIEIRGGRIVLYPLPQSKAKVEVKNDGIEAYYYDDRGRELRYRMGEDLFYILGNTLDGLTPASPIATFRQTLGYAQAIDRYGRKFFTEAAAPSMVLSFEGSIDRGALAAATETLKTLASGDNQRSVVALPGGAVLDPLGINPADADFIASRVMSIKDVSRILDVPPSRLHDTSDSTYSNISEESLNFVRHSVAPWTQAIASAFNKQLLSSPGYELRIDLSRLYEGTLKDQFDAWSAGIDAGIVEADYVAERMGLPQPEEPAPVDNPQDTDDNAGDTDGGDDGNSTTETE